jgi:hypothetical protein
VSFDNLFLALPREGGLSGLSGLPGSAKSPGWTYKANGRILLVNSFVNPHQLGELIDMCERRLDEMWKLMWTCIRTNPVNSLAGSGARRAIEELFNALRAFQSSILARHPDSRPVHDSELESSTDVQPSARLTGFSMSLPPLPLRISGASGPVPGSTYMTPDGTIPSSTASFLSWMDTSVPTDENSAADNRSSVIGSVFQKMTNICGGKKAGEGTKGEEKKSEFV